MVKSLNELEHDFSEEFVKNMKNRMIVGRQKYGSWRDNRVNVDALANAIARIEKYKETGNTEWLEDAANFIMMEWMLPLHPKAHRRPTDSHEAPKLKKFGD